MEIPPNLRHGDRYNFDCNLQYSLFTDGSGTVNGLELSSSCHDLRIGKLLFPSVQQIIKFGNRASTTCFDDNFPENIDHSLTNLSVVALVSGANNTRLGNFINLNEVDITYGLDIHQNVFEAIVKDATIMMFDDEFTSNMFITNSGLTASLVLSVFNTYQFQIEITAPVNQEWSSIEYQVSASALKGPGTLIDDLEKATLTNLVQRANTAVSRVQTAKMALSQVQQISATLKERLKAYTKEISTIDVLQSMLETETSSLKNGKPLIMERLDSLSEETANIRNMLANNCQIMICNGTCIPGFENTTCIDTVFRNITEPCMIEKIETEIKRKVVRVYEFPCESWEQVRELQRNCRCESNFQNCGCQITVTKERAVCVPEICTQTETADIMVQKLVVDIIDCVVNRTKMKVERPCSVMSDCADTSPDEECFEDNRICYNMTDQVLARFNETNKEAVKLFNDLQRTNRQLVASSLKHEKLIAKKQVLETRLVKVQDDITKLSNNTQLDNYNRVTKVNEVGLELAQMINSTKKFFNITKVDFELSVKSEYPQTIPLLVSILIQTKNFTRDITVTILFNFASKDTSLANAGGTISSFIEEHIAGNVQSSRKRRQNREEDETDFLRLKRNGVKLITMMNFFSMLISNLVELQNASHELHTTANTIVATISGNRFQPTSDDPELQALYDFHDTLALNLLESASLATANLFTQWQAEVNTFLNESGVLFGRECFGMADCFVLAVDDLTTIFNTAPAYIISQLTDMLPEAADSLQDISTSTSLSLSEAISKLKTVLNILQGAINTTYWSTTPPTISVPFAKTITILEKMPLNLECHAVYNLKFPIRYQWKKDDSILPFFNTSMLSIPTASLGDMGNYTCVVSNHAGRSASLPTFVTVVQAPKFYLEPFNQTVTTGAANPAKLQCNATSVPNPQFKWYFRSKNSFEFSIIPDMRGNELHIEDPKASDEGWYKCEAWVKYNDTYNISVISRAAYVSVVHSSVSVMSIPIRIEIESANRIDKVALQEHVTAVVENIISGSPPEVRPSFSNLTIECLTNTKAILMALINARNESFKGLAAKVLVDISREVSNCRAQLFNMAEQIKISLSSPNTYENVLRVIDKSKYGYVFRCPPGQQLDEESFILCSKCVHCTCWCVFVVCVCVYVHVHVGVCLLYVCVTCLHVYV